MGRTRRLWYRLRGSHDRKAQATGDPTGDLGGGTTQAPIGRVTPAEPDLAAESYRKDTAREIWLDAYKKLEEDEGTKKMVLAYETVLSNQLNGESAPMSPAIRRVGHDFWLRTNCQTRLNPSGAKQ